MKVKILGLDPGLESTGWYLLDGDLETGYIEPPEHYGVIKTSKWADKAKTVEVPNRERIDFQSRELMKLINSLGVTHVVAEDFVYMGRVGAASEQMVALVEHIRIRCEVLEIPCEIYTNGFWKTVLMKCRTANKNQVAHFITNQKVLKLNKEHLKRIDPGNHIRDAIAIAYCRYKFLREEQSHAEHTDSEDGHGVAVPTKEGGRNPRNARRNGQTSGRPRRSGR